MANKVIIDTWGWLSIWDKKEKRNEEVSKYYENALTENAAIYTTDYILDETITLLFRRLPYEKADEFISIIQEAKEKRVLYIEKIHDERFEASISLRKKYKDKPAISFTDLSTMVVMKEIGIKQIITSDKHFLKVGMGFEIIP